MKTVTAVEWLVQEIEKLYIGNFNITFLKQIEQAKEMEKQQQGCSEEEIYITYDKSDGEILCAFVDKEECEREAEESGCGMQTVILHRNF